MEETILREHIFVVHAVKGYEAQGEHVRKLFAKYKLDFQFFSNEDPDHLGKFNSKDYFTPTFLEESRKGIITCSFSHLLIYEKNNTR